MSFVKNPQSKLKVRFTLLAPFPCCIRIRATIKNKARMIPYCADIAEVYARLCVLNSNRKKNNMNIIGV